MISARFLILLYLFILTSKCIVSETPHLHLRTADMQHEARSRGSSGGIGVAGFILGPILFLFSFVLIWNNERKAAIDTRRLQLASTLVNEVNPNVPDQIRNANMKLTHITGTTQSQGPIYDDVSGLTLNGTVKIEREVEVKEFREFGSDNDRRVELIWVSSHQEGQGNDPSAWFINNHTTKASHVNVSLYLLNESQKDRLECTQTYQPNMQMAGTIAQKSGRYFPSAPQIQGEYIQFPGREGIESAGSLRVRFRYCADGPVSVIAQTHENTFQPFQIDRFENNGENDRDGTACDCCCCFMCACASKILAPIQEIDLIVQEMQTYQEMIDHELEGVKCRTWAIRVLAFFLMVGGICLFFSPITSLLGYIPLVGGVLKSVLGFAIFIAAVIICIPLFCLALAVSWLVFNPKVGVIILGIALVITGIVIAITVSNKPEAASESAHHLSAMILQ